MSVGSSTHASGAPARAADARLPEVIADFFLPEEERLDDRTRVLLWRVLSGVVGAIEADIRRHAARLLSARGSAADAEALLGGGGEALPRLMCAGLLRDPELMDELIARVRCDVLSAALTVDANGSPGGMLVRLSRSPDQAVSAAAAALIAAETRRTHVNENSGATGADLPADLHQRLSWWVAAAIRDSDVGDGATDQALAVAARHGSGADHDRLEAVAARLAVALDARPEDAPGLLIDAIHDGRLSLFVALLARALSLDHAVARALVIDRNDALLWRALRAVGMAREQLARVALALSDADPRRDIEAFADRLDDLAAIDPADARAALAPLALPRDFRAAIAALARAGRR